MSTGYYSDSSLEEENIKRHKHKRSKSTRKGDEKRHKHTHHSPERSRSPHHRKIKEDPDASPEDIPPNQRHRERRKHRHRDGHGERHSHRRHIKQEVESDGEQQRQRRERRVNDDRRREARRKREAENPDTRSFGQAQQNSQGTNQPKEKEKPNFGLSGKLTEDTNTYKGVVIKYNQPPEARKPKTRWRLYPFKGEEALPVLYIHRQSAYLLGRDRLVVDLPLDHPSCSKQHAVLQYRLVEYERDDGSVGRKVCPYVIDLGSANGTFVNNQKIEPQRYVQLLEKDMLKFGFSSREYVLLHEKSKNDEEGDDQGSD